MRLSNVYRTLMFASLCLFGAGSICRAENPVVQTNFTADPAPMVYKGIVYLYTSHDEDDANNFKMRDWRLYTSTDMVNWTDHGAIASLATFPWADQTNDAWAPQVIERGGKFYLYVPISAIGSPKNVIAVAVADSPTGPFKDALGHPLIDRGEGYIDPTVSIDTDGQAYLYWGNPNVWYVKLNKDMISYSGDIEKSGSRPQNYQEGPWFYKRNNHYYLAYASTCFHEGIGYAMSDHPTGPWVYKGQIMDPNKGSSGNHPGIIDYKGKSYVFGFNYRLNFALDPQHRERRSVNVASFTYNADGTIPNLPWWNNAGVDQVGSLNPYQRVEAETIAWTSGIDTRSSGTLDWAQGVRTAKGDDGGIYVTHVRADSYIKVRGVNFARRRPSIFSARVATATEGGLIELRLDGLSGPLIGTLSVSPTGGQGHWQMQSTQVSRPTGLHDLFLVFHGPQEKDLFDIDYWVFGKSSR